MATSRDNTQALYGSFGMYSLQKLKKLQAYWFGSINEIRWNSKNFH